MWIISQNYFNFVPNNLFSYIINQTIIKYIYIYFGYLELGFYFTYESLMLHYFILDISNYISQRFYGTEKHIFISEVLEIMSLC
jgi:hypothetical protein